MGGNALKNCTTRRYQAEEYFVLEDEVRKKFQDHFRTNAYPILAYRNKESFGDMDILVQAEHLPPRWVESVVALFDSKEHHKNGNVLSFEYKEFQIDLIVTPEEELVSSAQYFAYNDLGNLIGRVAHSMGLKLGHDGLTYKFMRAERYVFKEIKLLDDWEDILPVLGYSWERYSQGFDTLEDIFKFVVSSPFFNKSIYALENLNHASRVRNQKRKMYMEFLKWIESYEETSDQQSIAFLNICKATKHYAYQNYLFDKIPSFKEQYEATQKEFLLAQEYKKRFNGELVSQWTGLEKQELGKFMAWLKNTKDQDRWKKDIVSLNPCLVEGLVMYWFEKYKDILEG